MNNIYLYWTLIGMLAILLPSFLYLLIFALSLMDVFFTQVPEGQIVVIMRAKKAYRFLANIKDHWIDPDTGEIWREKRLNDGFDDIAPNGDRGSDKTRIKPPPADLPTSYSGIDWLGWWPYYRRHVYQFRWNKWEKKEGKDETEFHVKAHDEQVSSLYWTSGYAFIVHGAETKDKAPVNATIVLIVRVTNANTALFGVLNGWYAALDGKVLGSGRDFIGLSTIDDLTTIQHEEGDVPGRKNSTKSRRSFISKMMFLNEDPKQRSAEAYSDPQGNQSIRKTLGVEIIAASFMKYDITGELKKTIEEFTITEYGAKEKSKAYNIETANRAKRDRDVGSARAEAASSLSKSVGDNRLVADIVIAEMQRESSVAMADALKERSGAPLYLGGGMLPTINVGPGVERIEQKPESKKRRVKK